MTKLFSGLMIKKSDLHRKFGLLVNESVGIRIFFNYTVMNDDE